jgi:hypothetical protein
MFPKRVMANERTHKGDVPIVKVGSTNTTNTVTEVKVTTPRGVMKRFARVGENKLYVTVLDGSYVFWIVKHGTAIVRDDYGKDEIDCESAFERAKNAL